MARNLFPDGGHNARQRLADLVGHLVLTPANGQVVFVGQHPLVPEAEEGIAQVIGAPAVGVADAFDGTAVFQNAQLDQGRQTVIGCPHRQPGQARDVSPAMGAAGDSAQDRQAVFDVAAQLLVELKPDFSEQAALGRQDVALDIGQQADLGIDRDQVVGHTAQHGERFDQLLGGIAREEGRQIGQGEGLQLEGPGMPAIKRCGRVQHLLLDHALDGAAQHQKDLGVLQMEIPLPLQEGR